jgi:hypothetical protein
MEVGGMKKRFLVMALLGFLSSTFQRGLRPRWKVLDLFLLPSLAQSQPEKFFEDY